MNKSATQESQQNPNNSHSEREWQNKFFGMGAQCYYCRTPLTLKEATKDHRIPRCRGGSSSIKNIVPACLACNQKKGWKTEQEFVKARPTFPKPAQPLAGISTLTPVKALEALNEPTLFHRLRRESEGGCPIGFKSYA